MFLTSIQTKGFKDFKKVVENKSVRKHDRIGQPSNTWPISWQNICSILSRYTWYCKLCIYKYIYYS